MLGPIVVAIAACAPTGAVSEAPTTVSSTPVSPPTAVPSTAPREPVFWAAIRPVDAGELGVSWRPGCPVGVTDLRAIELHHWNERGEVLEGVLVVHADHAEDLVGVFASLFDARFPIQSVRPITAFDGDDDASMRANNTSAFNCRTISGTSTWSQHAYGGAVDINPLVNPWVRGGVVDPPEGAPFVDRSVDAPGLVRPGDVVTRAFAEIGWGWGGDWTTTLDYQHFSHNGR